MSGLFHFRPTCLYRIEKGGAIEESDKANQALLAIFPAMFLVMLTFLMMQLQSSSRMWMVFMTVPLGLIGVVPALLAFDAPFGFGAIALGGMIMRNPVILVDQIERNISGGRQGKRQTADVPPRPPRSRSTCRGRAWERTIEQGPGRR